jgi:hypothetical protein
MIILYLHFLSYSIKIRTLCLVVLLCNTSSRNLGLGCDYLFLCCGPGGFAEPLFSGSTFGMLASTVLRLGHVRPTCAAHTGISIVAKFMPLRSFHLNAQNVPRLCSGKPFSTNPATARTFTVIARQSQ